jgi:hypothetical protein
MKEKQQYIYFFVFIWLFSTKRFNICQLEKLGPHPVQNVRIRQKKLQIVPDPNPQRLQQDEITKGNVDMLKPT